MRILGLAIGLILGLAGSLAAYEVEEQRFYPGTGERVLRIISTADLAVFTPYLLEFQQQRPEIGIDYTVTSSTDLARAIRDGAPFDLALSSAMDLQFQLANDGFARRYRSAMTTSLPDWARWREVIFAFSAERAVVVVNAERIAGLPVPATRQELIALLRDNPERFQGAVGTYDVRDSGLGYLFATKETRSTDVYWRLVEVMGRLGPRLYCCSGQMIDDVAAGRLAVAYNVLGSYAAERLARNSGGRVQILRMEDFENIMLRTAIIPQTAQEVEPAGALIDLLLETGLRATADDWPLPPLGEAGGAEGTGFSPIRLGPALMVYLDPLNRRTFLAEWENAMEQR
jgi:iron(III) transport system substrate-binding protein